MDIYAILILFYMKIQLVQQSLRRLDSKLKFIIIIINFSHFFEILANGNRQYVTDYPNRPAAFIWERIHFSMVVYFVVAVEEPFSNDAVVVILGIYFCADLAAMIASGHLGASIDHNQGNRHGFDPPF